MDLNTHGSASQNRYRQVSGRGDDARIVAPILDRLPNGYAMLGGSGQVLFANAALHRITHEERGLYISSGHLRASNSHDNETLRAAIARALHDEAAATIHSAILMRGLSSSHPVVVTVMPMAPDDRTLPATVHAVALVVVLDAQPVVTLSSGFLREAFQLSRAEAEIAIGLLKGDTLGDVADARGITLNTARTQLKSIMGKTGVNRQSDLINLLARCDTALPATTAE